MTTKFLRENINEATTYGEVGSIDQLRYKIGVAQSHDPSAPETNLDNATPITQQSSRGGFVYTEEAKKALIAADAYALKQMKEFLDLVGFSSASIPESSVPNLYYVLRQAVENRASNTPNVDGKLKAYQTLKQTLDANIAAKQRVVDQAEKVLVADEGIQENYKTAIAALRVISQTSDLARKTVERENLNISIRRLKEHLTLAQEVATELQGLDFVNQELVGSFHRDITGILSALGLINASTIMNDVDLRNDRDYGTQIQLTFERIHNYAIRIYNIATEASAAEPQRSREALEKFKKEAQQEFAAQYGFDQGELTASTLPTAVKELVQKQYGKSALEAYLNDTASHANTVAAVQKAQAFWGRMNRANVERVIGLLNTAYQPQSQAQTTLQTAQATLTPKVIEKIKLLEKHNARVAESAEINKELQILTTEETRKELLRAQKEALERQIEELKSQINAGVTGVNSTFPPEVLKTQYESYQKYHSAGVRNAFEKTPNLETQKHYLDYLVWLEGTVSRSTADPTKLKNYQAAIQKAIVAVAGAQLAPAPAPTIATPGTAAAPTSGAASGVASASASAPGPDSPRSLSEASSTSTDGSGTGINTPGDDPAAGPDAASTALTALTAAGGASDSKPGDDSGAGINTPGDGPSSVDINAAAVVTTTTVTDLDISSWEHLGGRLAGASAEPAAEPAAVTAVTAVTAAGQTASAPTETPAPPTDTDGASTVAAPPAATTPSAAPVSAPQPSNLIFSDEIKAALDEVEKQYKAVTTLTAPIVGKVLKEYVGQQNAASTASPSAPVNTTTFIQNTERTITRLNQQIEQNKKTLDTLEKTHQVDLSHTHVDEAQRDQLQEEHRIRQENANLSATADFLKKRADLVVQMERAEKSMAFRIGAAATGNLLLGHDLDVREQDSNARLREYYATRHKDQAFLDAQKFKQKVMGMTPEELDVFEAHFKFLQDAANKSHFEEFRQKTIGGKMALQLDVLIRDGKPCYIFWSNSPELAKRFPDFLEDVVREYNSKCTNEADKVRVEESKFTPRPGVSRAMNYKIVRVSDGLKASAEVVDGIMDILHTTITQSMGIQIAQGNVATWRKNQEQEAKMLEEQRKVEQAQLEASRQQARDQAQVTPS